MSTFGVIAAASGALAAVVWHVAGVRDRGIASGMVVVQGSGNVTQVSAGATSVVVQGEGNVTVMGDGAPVGALPSAPELPCWCAGCDRIAEGMRWAWAGGGWCWRCASCRAEACMVEVER